MKTKGNTVRLTQQAHILCSEKAEEGNTSLKAVASEAIFLMVQGEDRDREHQDAIEIYKERIRIQSKQLAQDRWFALGAFVLGVVVGICLRLVVGVML